MPIFWPQLYSSKHTKMAGKDPQPACVTTVKGKPLSQAPWSVRLGRHSNFKSLYEHLLLLIGRYNGARHRLTDQPIAHWNRGAGNE